MENIEVKLLSEMAKLEINVLIKNDLLELMIAGEYDMAFELAHNEIQKKMNCLANLPWMRVMPLIDAFDPAEEKARRARNEQFILNYRR